MPQLDFTWWMMKFFLMWTSVIIVLSMMTIKAPAMDEQNESYVPSIQKKTTEWQWF